ncbi:PREDICTED: uncharacterized protein LOC104606496 isoform X3 [Nelumbo nucifera]|uniref:Uncharacterized protein LOC104606496 isoform X3 n=1 Tax=Nelumbo nucifera TaxID=4432 RepID=A0A1U8Q9W7_NELNU|nr:PREDICTED: uncharacterized protein LOC104606496 isoform X3 [Nelumbo nucifera]
MCSYSIYNTTLPLPFKKRDLESKRTIGSGRKVNGVYLLDVLLSHPSHHVSRRDLQSYLSHLSIFLATESNKFFILVDNRPWSMYLDSGAAHLWQFMVTKSRLSPFANTKAQKGRKNLGKRFDFKNSSISNTSKPNESKRWSTLVDAAVLCQKKVLLPENLGNSLLWNHQLNQTLYGFIVFEVAWTSVRGINYLNELQTDTCMALEAKLMKRWEFDSIEHASSSIHSWFSGTLYERVLLRKHLYSITGEVFFDAQEDLSWTRPSSDGESICSDVGGLLEKSPCSIGRNFGVRFANVENRTSALHRLPPATMPCKRRNMTKYVSSGYEGNRFSKKTHGEIVDSPIQSETSTSTSSNDSENTVEASEYRDVLILFRFNDHDLPFKLREIIMPDVRLLTLLEYGLPAWVIFLQSYPVICHLYRPWMCPLARALYVLISVVTVLVGFFDLYKNVPILKATAAHLCGPLFDWIENWEMISRIKYLGTILFLHNFEKAVRWFLMVTRFVRSFLSILMWPIQPLLELLDFCFPLWDICFDSIGTFCSVIWITIGSSCSIVVDLLEVLFSPLWFIISVIWSIGSLIYPMFLTLGELLYTPIRLVAALASCITFLYSSIFDFLGKLWLSISIIFRIASSSEAAVSTSEVSMWRTLWNDLFSQIFRAIRSIINGLAAFFIACNRHRLSTYNHIQEFLQQISHLAFRSQPQGSSHCKQKHGAPTPMETRGNVCSKHPQHANEKAHTRHYWRIKGVRGSWISCKQ